MDPISYIIISIGIYLLCICIAGIFYCEEVYPKEIKDHPLGPLIYPIIPFIFLNRLINKLKQTQMNLKILGKAMGYMFMPTLGVLLMLLIGFFDPLAMWNFIKSDNGWAVTVRIILFLAETALIIVMYCHFLDQWEKEQKQIAKEKDLKGAGKNPNIIAEWNYRNEIRQLFKNSNDRDLFHQYKTESEDVIIIERTKYQA